MRILPAAAIAVLICSLHANSQPACDESDVRPPVTSADVQIAKRAAEILNSPARWNRADTRDCPADEKTFSLYCALEKATDEISTAFEHRGAAMQESRFVIDDITPKAANYDHRLMDYNNDPSTTFADVQKFFRLLQERIAARLNDPVHNKAGCVASAADAKDNANTDAKTQLPIIRRVREILNSPEKWDRASTQSCRPDAKTFGLYCAFEKATREITGGFSGDGDAIDRVRALIDRKYPARLVGYNNDPATTFADMQKLLQTVEDELAK
jgi:hypothetical protein